MHRGQPDEQQRDAEHDRDPTAQACGSGLKRESEQLPICRRSAPAARAASRTHRTIHSGNAGRGTTMCRAIRSPIVQNRMRSADRNEKIRMPDSRVVNPPWSVT